MPLLLGINSTSLVFAGAAPIVIIPFVEHFNGHICKANVTADFKYLNSTYPEWFWPASTPSDPLLTVPGCMALCSKGWGTYPDSGQRLFEWIVPGVLLLTNQHFPPIGRRRYLMLAHLLGDPADSMLRLLSMIEDWVDSSQMGQRIRREIFTNGGITQYNIQPEMIAVIIAAAARLFPSLHMDSFSTKLSNSLNIYDKAELKARCDALHKAATALRNQRLHDTRRTAVAILIYIFGIVAVFVAAIGGSANPSGGKVSPAMMLVWLLPLVLLSNAIGDYACWTASQETLQEFLSVVHIDPEIKHQSTWTRNFTEMACSGTVLQRRPLNRRQASLIAISVLPVALSCFTALVVDDTGPTWFSCRCTFIVGSLLLWLVSFAATALMQKWIRSRYLWLCIFVKDILVAIPILVLLLLATCGLFNSCACVSGELFHGIRAVVIINEVPYWDRCSLVYKAAVGTGLGLQILLLGLVRYFQREGFRTMWWREPNAQLKAGSEGDSDKRWDELPLALETSIAASLKQEATFQTVEMELDEIDLEVAS